MIIIRILFFCYLLLSCIASSGLFEWPESIPNFIFENEICIDSSGDVPSSYLMFYIDDGPLECASMCEAVETCSAFMYSHYEKDGCRLFVLDSAADTVINTYGTAANFLDGSSSHVSSSMVCEQDGSPFFITSSYLHRCFMEYRCYIHQTFQPSVAPSYSPSFRPSGCPSAIPSVLPSVAPSTLPSRSPSFTPSVCPSSSPSTDPSGRPSFRPSVIPSTAPSFSPSVIPTFHPSVKPSVRPTVTPSVNPTVRPTVTPSLLPSVSPTFRPTANPTVSPSDRPSTQPSSKPSVGPSFGPTVIPSFCPSTLPSVAPSYHPTAQPSDGPSVTPTVVPTFIPTVIPTDNPIGSPSTNPSHSPSYSPTVKPTNSPSVKPSTRPSRGPVCSPTVDPSVFPTVVPSDQPSVSPSHLPSVSPTRTPTVRPSVAPSANPSVLPSRHPSVLPTVRPSEVPSVVPTVGPSINPSVDPTWTPSYSPSTAPSWCPSVVPTTAPSYSPSCIPTRSPSDVPSVTPTYNPSTSPTLTNPCSLPDDAILGSVYVDLIQSESDFTDDDELFITLQVPQKYDIVSIKFTGAETTASEYVGEDTAYWTLNVDPDESCLYRPSFSCFFADAKQNKLMNFTVGTMPDDDVYQYLYNVIIIELTELVYTDTLDVPFNRTVIYDIPYAIQLKNEIKLSVTMSAPGLVVFTDPPTVNPTMDPSFHPTVNPSQRPTVIPTHAPSTLPSTSPSFAPSDVPSTIPTTGPTGVPTPLTVDHLFTSYALLTPDTEGSSNVQINFTTIIKLPWHGVAEELAIGDPHDLILNGTESFLLHQDCYSAYSYEFGNGFCVDEDYAFAPFMYSTLSIDACKEICDQEVACQAYSFDPSSAHCEIIGVDITMSHTAKYANYAPAGENWSFVAGNNAVLKPPVQFAPFGSYTCYLKQTPAWQSDLCSPNDHTVVPNFNTYPECFCLQDWSLSYDSADVCAVSGWWELQVGVENIVNDDTLVYDTDVFVGLKSACAQVIGSTEICLDSAPCTIVAYSDATLTQTTNKLYIYDTAYFQVTVGTNAPITSVEIIDMTIQRENENPVTVNPTEYSFSNDEIITINEKRFSGVLSVALNMTDSLFTGSVAGIPTSISMTVGLNYGNGVRRQLTVYIPDGETPSVDLSLSIMVYPKACEAPYGELHSYRAETCLGGTKKDWYICEVGGWNIIHQECFDEEITEITVITDTQENEDLMAITSMDTSDDNSIIVISNQDEKTVQFWRTATLIGVGVILIILAIRWFISVKNEERQIKKQIAWRLEHDDSEWEDTTAGEYSTEASAYTDSEIRIEDSAALAMAYNNIFRKAYRSGVESDL